ncbi:MAG: hypothetical protein PHU88_08965 [candidate division Zixibacteria bacterium]|nr:hypothetical protein [candidate division Zixibacteria bacterium]MDD5427487.1 hypothetical protein [candidate division Zixibacteria bacterium]
MRKIASFIIALGLLAFFVGCADDVFVEPPPTLTGNYVGTYTLKEGTQVPIEEPITWRFSQNSYSKRLDTTRIDSNVFCDFDGTYELENGVNLNQTNGNPTRATCTVEQNPTGFFQLDQSTDTLKMTQYDSETLTLKIIKLLKAE